MALKDGKTLLMAAQTLNKFKASKSYDIPKLQRELRSIAIAIIQPNSKRFVNMHK